MACEKDLASFETERWANLRLTLSNTELKFFSKCSQSSFVISRTLNEKISKDSSKAKTKDDRFLVIFQQHRSLSKKFPQSFCQVVIRFHPVQRKHMFFRKDKRVKEKERFLNNVQNKWR